MMNTLLPFTLIELILIALTLAVGITLIFLRKKRVLGRTGLLAFGAFLMIALLLYMAMVVGLLKTSLFSYCFLYFTFLGLPASFFAFSLDHLVGRKPIFLLLIAGIILLPVLVQALFISQASQGFLYINESTTSFEVIRPSDAMGWLIFIYAKGIIVAAAITLVVSMDFFLPWRKNRALIILLIASGVSVLLDMVRFTDLIPVADPVLNLFSVSVIGLGLIHYYVVTRPRDGNLTNVEGILNCLEDGIIVLNAGNIIIHMNSSAVEITGVPIQNAYGRRIDQIFINWNNIDLQQGSENRLGFRASVRVGEDWKNLDVSILPAEQKEPARSGKVLVVRDLSRLRTDAGQFARETMFVFLRSLVNSFKDSQTIQEFLEHALYQTLYTFSLDNGQIYLLEPTSRPEAMIYTLSARHGSLDVKSILPRLYPPGKITSEEKSIQAIIINDVKADERVAEKFKDMSGDLSLAFFPLGIEQEIFGLLVLGRLQVNGFDPYEEIRLSAAADEIASFIYKEREKQQQIASMERQRLVRDLHDSITQKLYGLLTITEAVQLGLEAGATDKAIGLMAKVNENARQAVREMRLFLHQLDPVDIEREGFISALHQRLAAVEGRSDIKAHFKVIGKFSLSKEKERAIYYIANEALNNIVKHARAKSISIKLRRRLGRCYLDIIDDGCSFDPVRVTPGGRGLRNMQERAEQIGATLKIMPSREKGTRISISFPE